MSFGSFTKHRSKIEVSVFSAFYFCISSLRIASGHSDGDFSVIFMVFRDKEGVRSSPSYTSPRC